MMNRTVETENAPAPIGPYSQAVWAGNTLYMSGQIAINLESGELVMDSIQSETQQVMRNIEAVLNEANLDFTKVIKCSIFLSDMNLFAEVNEIYGSFFSGNYPARETVEVSKLPKAVNVEISVIAVR